MDPVQDAVDQADLSSALEERRCRRMAALKAAEGLWKNRADIPQDGVEYQDQLRDEWR
ncbi:hypothetical protein [Pseudoduganella violaceinigra]|uniref:hypothetical protein n=1 Tax=Pseudoduganella violaceinigra TaxID=246602 RepID=UPI0012B5154D|nr:hypothetical protein [Pseudoduganella violaceinigra]